MGGSKKVDVAFVVKVRRTNPHSTTSFNPATTAGDPNTRTGDSRSYDRRPNTFLTCARRRVCFWTGLRGGLSAKPLHCAPSTLAHAGGLAGHCAAPRQAPALPGSIPLSRLSSQWLCPCASPTSAAISPHQGGLQSHVKMHVLMLIQCVRYATTIENARGIPSQRARRKV